MTIDLSIIIVSWNTSELLARCLASIQDNCDSSFHDGIETFVVDNGSSDGSVTMVRQKFQWVQLIENDQNVGFARANNQAALLCKGRYILLLNSDAILQPGNLTDLLTFADAHPQAGIVGVKLINPDGTFQAALNDFPTPRLLMLESWGLLHILCRNSYYPSYPPHKSRHATACDWVGGACLLARSAAIRQVGLLDEAYFMNVEETDWCYRMWQSGWEVWYTPDVRVIHLGGASGSRQSSKYRLQLIQSKIRFLQKYHGSTAASIARLNYLMSSLGKSLLYRVHSAMTTNIESRYNAAAHWQVARQLVRT